jgi:membrane protease YdiL (CAAX protease family)
MPTITENHRSTARSGLRRLVDRHPVAAFLIMLYAITWTVFLPIVLQGRGLLALPIDLTEGLAFNAVVSIASVLGVALPAFLVTAATGGKEGVGDLLGRSLRWRVGVRWYLIALFGLLAVLLLGVSVFQGPASLEALAEKWPLFLTMFLPEVLFPFLFIQIFEEAGWTGFMQNALQERRGPLAASVLVAPAFMLMHLPPLLIDSGVGLALLVVAGALVVAMAFFRILIMWLYNASGGSVLIVALFHSAYNSATGLGGQGFTGPTLPYAAGALVVLAVAITVFTRGRLGYEPKRPRRPAEAGEWRPNRECSDRRSSTRTEKGDFL